MLEKPAVVAARAIMTMIRALVPLLKSRGSLSTGGRMSSRDLRNRFILDSSLEVTMMMMVMCGIQEEKKRIRQHTKLSFSQFI